MSTMLAHFTCSSSFRILRGRTAGRLRRQTPAHSEIEEAGCIATKFAGLRQRTRPSGSKAPKADAASIAQASMRKPSAHAAGRDFLQLEAGQLLGREVDVDVVAIGVPDVDLHGAGARHLARFVAHSVAVEPTHELLEAAGGEGEVLELQQPLGLRQLVDPTKCTVGSPPQ